jgi:hypothetical protein
MIAEAGIRSTRAYFATAPTSPRLQKIIPFSGFPDRHRRMTKLPIPF